MKLRTEDTSTRYVRSARVNLRAIEVFDTKLIERYDSVEPLAHSFVVGIDVLLLMTSPESKRPKEGHLTI